MRKQKKWPQKTQGPHFFRVGFGWVGSLRPQPWHQVGLSGCTSARLFCFCFRQRRFSFVTWVWIPEKKAGGLEPSTDERGWSPKTRGGSKPKQGMMETKDLEKKDWIRRCFNADFWMDLVTKARTKYDKNIQKGYLNHSETDPRTLKLTQGLKNPRSISNPTISKFLHTSMP